MITTNKTNKVSEESINIRYSDLDFDKCLKPFSLLNFFQDIASDNAEQLGFGYSYIYPRDYMWVLLKYRIEFEEYPKDIQDLILRTEPRGYQKIFAFRNFELLSQNKVLAKASSMWSLVNIKTKSLASIEKIIPADIFPKFESNEKDLSFGKIPTLNKIDYRKDFEVRYNDIDVNRHANNGNYIVWALEPIDLEFRMNHTLKNIDMFFKKEVKYGEKLTSEVEILNENTTLHRLHHTKTGEDLCLVKCEWI